MPLAALPDPPRRVRYLFIGPAGEGRRRAVSIHRASRAEDMVERRKELDARYGRKKKLAKLKARLATAKDGRERDTILKKIHKISPWWAEPKKA
jgi:hypothetical protein